MKNILISYDHKNIEIIDCENIKFNKDEILRLKKIISFKKKDNIIFGIGSGIQEQMASEWDNNSNLFCLGAAIDFITGNQLIAPKLIVKFKLEWFWRFILSPKKMYKRVFLDPIIFIYSILIYKISSLNE